MTVSAEVRLTPRPPALVLTRNTDVSGSVLNVSIYQVLDSGVRIKITKKYAFNLRRLLCLQDSFCRPDERTSFRESTNSQLIRPAS